MDLQSITYHSNWLRSEGLPDSLDNLTCPHIRTWLASLTERNENSTVRTRYKGLRRFCRWLVAEDILDTDPMDGMEPPPAQNKPVPILTDDELVAVLKRCQGKGFDTQRNEALIRVLMDTGCRVSELVGITLDDLDLDRESATVTGKSNKLRPLHFSAKTARALDRYLRERAKHRYASAPALFLSQRGPMSGDGVRDLDHRLSIQAGLDDLHPHRFRHTLAHVVSPERTRSCRCGRGSPTTPASSLPAPGQVGRVPTGRQIYAREATQLPRSPCWRVAAAVVLGCRTGWGLWCRARP